DLRQAGEGFAVLAVDVLCDGAGDLAGRGPAGVGGTEDEREGVADVAADDVADDAGALANAAGGGGAALEDDGAFGDGVDLVLHQRALEGAEEEAAAGEALGAEEAADLDVDAVVGAGAGLGDAAGDVDDRDGLGVLEIVNEDGVAAV